MKRIVGYFDHLHFTESRLGEPVVKSGTLTIPVSGLLTLKGHPLNDGTLKQISGYLVFAEVSKSARKLTEYIGDPRHPQGFKDEYLVEDIPPGTFDENATTYLLEGTLNTPVAWVDWEVRARNFELHTDS
ncbi:hypothetical protein [Comamonas odontotermitis]|uniref:hypothetical protein n=1 Tax=Comamonas odontotermitis TaxID=379895 RepID=UPI001CC6805F|nr:hypothetical protein [Comamonas odontotermitis]UBB16077.1 hypothetical protein LAD35_14730 [Comamonas odontotermitis]